MGAVEPYRAEADHFRERVYPSRRGYGPGGQGEGEANPYGGDGLTVDDDVWPIVMEAIAGNMRPRISWSSIFGASVNVLCASYFRDGFPADWAYAELVEKALAAKITDKESLRRLKIGVYSNFARLRLAELFRGGERNGVKSV